MINIIKSKDNDKIKYTKSLLKTKGKKIYNRRIQNFNFSIRVWCKIRICFYKWRFREKTRA